MIANNKYDDTYALMTGWEVIDYVKKSRKVLKKLLLQQGTLVWDIKNAIDAFQNIWRQNIVKYN